MKTIFLIILYIFPGASGWASSDVTCKFKTAKATITVKGYHGGSWQTGQLVPNYNIEWVKDDDASGKLETLHTLGMPATGSGPSINDLPVTNTTEFDFNREGKLNRISIYICEGGDNKNYKALLGVGKLRDPGNIRNMDGEVFEGTCDRASIDASKDFSCPRK